MSTESSNASDKPPGINAPTEATSSKYDGYEAFLQDPKRVLGWQRRSLAPLLQPEPPDFAEWDEPDKVSVLNFWEGHVLPVSQYVGPQSYEALAIHLSLPSITTSHTRLVMVQIGRKSSKRLLLDCLGRVYDIDPTFLWQHFLRSYDYGTASYKQSYKGLLPSESCLLTPVFHFNSSNLNNRISGFVPRQRVGCHQAADLPPSILVFVSSIGYPGEPTSTELATFYKAAPADTNYDLPSFFGGVGRFVASIRSWDTAQVNLATNDFRYFIRPLCRHYLRDLRCFIATPDGATTTSPSLVSHSSQDYYRERTMLKSFSRQLEEIDRSWAPEGGASSRSVFEDYQRDIRETLEQLEDEELFARKQHSDELIRAQLQEARKSTRMATSVTRLTQLAFFFVPLSFISSFCGMNMEVFGTGNLQLWHFFVAAIVTLTICALPVLMHYTPGVVTVCAVKLFLRSPIVGFWFLAFVACNSREVVKELCDRFIIAWASYGGTRITGQYWPDNQWSPEWDQVISKYPPFYARGRQRHGEVLKIDLCSRFWRDKGLFIASTVNGWLRRITPQLGRPDLMEYHPVDRYLSRYRWWRVEHGAYEDDG